MIQFSQHSYKCYLRACIGFSNALFHIFSGPLFANVQGYVYLDLLVWGLSPLTFLFLRQHFFNFFRKQNKGVRSKTFKGIIILNCVIFISFFFLNYSPKFNWNYFSRTFNIQVGFFIFDMLIRTFDLLVQVQIQKQSDKQCQTYCKFQHATNIFSYFLVFYLATIFDVNQRNNGPIIFAICSVFSFISVVLIPILYYYHHRDQINNYKQLQQIQDQTIQQQYQDQHQHYKHDKQSIKSTAQLFQQPKQTIQSVIGISMLNVSLIINTNYFSLWMMEPLGTNKQSSYQQYNITIQMVSGFFLLSSIGYYIAYKMFYAIKIAPTIAKLILIIYGIFLTLIYWKYQVNYVSVLILGFGFHQLCNMQLAQLLKNKWKVDLRLYLKNQVFAYFILPLIFLFFNVGQTSLKIYASASGIFLILGSILI